MQLDALLRSHGFMKVERPPRLWEADTDNGRFIPLLGEMIAASLSRGAQLEALTLNAANVIAHGSCDGSPISPAACRRPAYAMRTSASSTRRAALRYSFRG